MLLMGAIFALSSIPGDDTAAGKFLGLVPPGLQNALHVPIFAMLAWLWCRALGDMPHGKKLGIAAALSLAWAGLDELHQFYVPGRFASLTDIVLNTIGVGAGMVLASWQRTSPGR